MHDATTQRSHAGKHRHPIMRFLGAYVKSMRLYYAFVTGISGWVGVAYYQHLMPGQLNGWRGGAILAALFLCWGVNQIFNDYFGLPEDRINAPHRPMVTGELPARPALWLSSLLLLALCGLSCLLNPWSVLPILAGVGLNLLYEKAKAWSLWGNLVFGLSIAMCPVYGYLAAGPLPSPVITPALIAVFIIVVLLNAVMTYFTYFKDYAGDQQAGKKTFVVRHGLHVARIVGLLGAGVPITAFLVCVGLGWIDTGAISLGFFYCAVIAIGLQFWTAVRYYRDPTGTRTYTNLALNIRACVAGQIALIALVNPLLAFILLATSLVLIGALFNLHRDARA